MHLRFAFVDIVNYELRYIKVLLLYHCLVDMDCIIRGHV